MNHGNEIAQVFQDLQLEIVEALSAHDGQAEFQADSWVRTEGGGGVTMTMDHGRVIEKGGVAFSKVTGEITPVMKQQMGMQGDSFLATGVSIVLHSVHPLHPTIHMNVRYFETNEGKSWFGGGIDLTPMYVNMQEAAKFHQHLKSICDTFHLTAYDRYKAWADEYFYLPHRNETRGVGGIFFDHLVPESDDDRLKILDFCLALGKKFPSIYQEQTMDTTAEASPEQYEWQSLRRSRYVEYNLLFDRGTKFGIVSNGRTESILLSMPPSAIWKYNFNPAAGSEEEQTMERLKKQIDWISFL
jgi:coproporphyrinogen III oxidase